MSELSRYDNIILKLFQQRNGKINRKKVSKAIDNPTRYPNINHWFQNRYSNCGTLDEVFIHLRLGIDEGPRCKTCGKEIRLLRMSDIDREYCCVKCQCSTNHTKMKETTQKYWDEVKNGAENTRSKKRTETMNERYGGLSKFSKDRIDIIKSKGIKTIQERYGCESWSDFVRQDWVQEKMLTTAKERHGVNSWSELHSLPEINEKRKASGLKHIQEKFGVEDFHELYMMAWLQEKKIETLKAHGWNSYSEMITDPRIKEKIQNTIKEKYGYDSLGDFIASPQNQEKVKKTLKRKYGVDSISEFLKLPETEQKFLKTIKERWHVNSRTEFQLLEEIQYKKENTYRRNNSYGKSKDEDRIYTILKDSYPDIIRQYKEKRYPFNCDYYIPSLDVFIEYQGYPGHGGHQYDPSNESGIELVCILQEKANILRNKRQTTELNLYDKYIRAWTIMDPKKRSVAAKNKLNYIEIWPGWTIEEIIEEIKKFE